MIILILMFLFVIDLEAGQQSALLVAGILASFGIAGLKKIWPALKDTVAYAVVLLISVLVSILVLYNQGNLHSFGDFLHGTQAMIFWSVSTYHFLVSKFTK